MLKSLKIVKIHKIQLQASNEYGLEFISSSVSSWCSPARCSIMFDVFEPFTANTNNILQSWISRALFARFIKTHSFF